MSNGAPAAAPLKQMSNTQSYLPPPAGPLPGGSQGPYGLQGTPQSQSQKSIPPPFVNPLGVGVFSHEANAPPLHSGGGGGGGGSDRYSIQGGDPAAKRFKPSFN